MAKTRIVVGMSGGVDSSVAAALLQRAGWDVIGVTLDFVSDGSGCCDAADAHAVCQVLGIRHVHRDCSPAFEERVIQPFCDAYAAALTPSPCPGCNATMKIPELLEVADEVGATHVATGHYAQLAQTYLPRPGFAPVPPRIVVKAAADERKDQSYMLSRLSQEQLRRLVLPLGGMTKAEVRALAAELNLPVAQRPDSEDLCFAPSGYRALLAERGVEGTPGPILNAAGKQLGTHTGLIDYTIGQRSGLGIGGAPEPYYVMAKDAATNALVVGFAEEAKMRAALVADPVWQAIPTAPQVPLQCTVKLRYRSRAVPCTLAVEGGGQAGKILPEKDGKAAETLPVGLAAPSLEGKSPASDMLRVTLADPQPLTAPGQFAVFYSGDTVLGSGIIAAVIRER